MTLFVHLNALVAAFFLRNGSELWREYLGKGGSGISSV